MAGVSDGPQFAPGQADLPLQLPGPVQRMVPGFTWQGGGQGLAGLYLARVPKEALYV